VCMPSFACTVVVKQASIKGCWRRATPALTKFLPQSYSFLTPSLPCSNTVVAACFKIPVMKHIMLPTDLTVQSLWPIHNIVRDARGEKICIHVVHLIGMPMDIAGLLWARENRPYRAVPEGFNEAFELLCHRYKPVIEKMVLRFVYGNTTRLLHHHLESAKIEAVYLLDNYQYGKPMANSIDLAGMLHKCPVPVQRLPLHAGALSDYQILSALLDDNLEAEQPQQQQPEPTRPRMARYS
jgi:hypothetical protein